MPDQAGPPDGPIETGTPADAGQAGRPAAAPPALDGGLRAEIDAIVACASHDPHAVLGAHPGPDGVTVRALRPLAETVTVVLPDGRRFPASHLHEGVFAATLPVTEVPDYRIAVTYPGGGPGEPGRHAHGPDDRGPQGREGHDRRRHEHGGSALPAGGR